MIGSDRHKLQWFMLALLFGKVLSKIEEDKLNGMFASAWRSATEGEREDVRMFVNSMDDEDRAMIAEYIEEVEKEEAYDNT